MKGRKRKPTVLKILAGKPGHRPLPKDEPMPTGRAERPKWLGEGAVRVWEDLAPGSYVLGLLTSRDGFAFGVFCTLAAEFVKDSAGMSANRISRLDALMQRFGMDPGSRTRISVKKPDEGNDETRFFGGQTA